MHYVGWIILVGLVVGYAYLNLGLVKILLKTLRG
jgi:hypothetical protein